MRAAVAVRVDKDNPLSALELKDGWPSPEVGPDQVRVRLAATTVNMHDLWALRGVGVRRESFPRILGCDIVGWDDAGNEVMVTGSFADPDAGGGDETFDPRRLVDLRGPPGSFGEYAVAPTRNVIAKPPVADVSPGGVPERQLVEHVSPPLHAGPRSAGRANSHPGGGGRHCDGGDRHGPGGGPQVVVDEPLASEAPARL